MASSPQNPDPTYYELFEVAESATTEEISEAYKDIISTLPTSRGIWMLRWAAKGYLTLSDPSSRQEYDNKLREINAQRPRIAMPPRQQQN